MRPSRSPEKSIFPHILLLESSVPKSGRGWVGWGCGQAHIAWCAPCSKVLQSTKAIRSFTLSDLSFFFSLWLTSSIAISSNGFILCFTPSVTTPDLSGFTRICWPNPEAGSVSLWMYLLVERRHKLTYLDGIIDDTFAAHQNAERRHLEFRKKANSYAHDRSETAVRVLRAWRRTGRVRELQISSSSGSKMPPKKKKGKGKKKKKKDGMSCTKDWTNDQNVEVTFCGCDESLFIFVDKGELTVEDKYKRTIQEIEVLRDELGKKVDVWCWLMLYWCKCVLDKPLSRIVPRMTSNDLHFQLRERKSPGGPRT